jgi:hypothetical protein
MALSAIAVTKANPRNKAYKLTDSGGLYLLVTPTGGRYWRLNYRFDGKYRTMAMGVYPEVGLADARGKRDDARKMLAIGNDPSVQQKLVAQQRELEASSSFEAVAIEWLAKREKEGLAEITLNKAKWLLDFTYPAIAIARSAKSLCAWSQIQRSFRVLGHYTAACRYRRRYCEKPAVVRVATVVGG